MHYAAREGRKDVVELLLASKADVNAKSEDGWTPLHEAADTGEWGAAGTAWRTKPMSMLGPTTA